MSWSIFFKESKPPVYSNAQPLGTVIVYAYINTTHLGAGLKY
jgi:hypothetical protein